MAIRVYKKNTAGRRNMTIVKPAGVTEKKPEKGLTAPLHRLFGRGGGKISVRHKGGGHKRRYRLVDFRQTSYPDVPATVLAIEKDPNRSALIALVRYENGAKGYVLATEGLRTGARIVSGENAPIANGNRLKLRNIPTGTTICNIEMSIGRGGQIVRSAGAQATLMALDDRYAQIKLASGEIRLINKECYATIGQVSNFEHGTEKIGKAGRNRWRGKRPAVRGTAMNPVDHPHGGGEGRQPLGMHPRTPWGKLALGKKTRRKKKASSKAIVKRRK